MEDNIKRLQLRLPESLWLEFRKKLLEDGISIQDFFTKKVLEYLEKGGFKKW